VPWPGLQKEARQSKVLSESHCGDGRDGREHEQGLEEIQSSGWAGKLASLGLCCPGFELGFPYGSQVGYTDFTMSMSWPLIQVKEGSSRLWGRAEAMQRPACPSICARVALAVRS
jgi:hypothetical protein